MAGRATRKTASWEKLAVASAPAPVTPPTGPYTNAERDEAPHTAGRLRLETGKGTHKDARSKVGPLARRVKRDYRLRHARHDRILRRLKLRASGCRSGGRDSENVPARRREADPVIRRRVRGRGGRSSGLLQESRRAPRRARRSAAADAGQPSLVACALTVDLRD